MSLFTRSFPKWLPIGVALALAIGVSYVFAQQVYRNGANDPQVALARDAAAALSSGVPANAVVPTGTVDPSRSPAPFVIVLDAQGAVVASSMRLDEATPVPPKGVLDAATASGENVVTWQPRADTRIAAVVVGVRSGAGGWVVAGRSLAIVEERIDRLTSLAGIGLLSALAITFGATLLADWMADRHEV